MLFTISSRVQRPTQSPSEDNRDDCRERHFEGTAQANNKAAEPHGRRDPEGGGTGSGGTRSAESRDGGTLDPAEPKSGAHGATRPVFRTEVPRPPLPGRHSAQRVGPSRCDVTVHGEFQGVGSHPHRGTQRPQQGGGGLVRAPGVEAARLGQECVRGRGENKRFHPAWWGWPRPDRAPPTPDRRFLLMAGFFGCCCKSSRFPV